MLSFRDLTVQLEGRKILSGITFSLRPHRLTVLVGKNGSGKSTLLSCVNQQLHYTGSILEGEQDLALMAPRDRAKRIAILPQTIPAPHITALEMVAFGRNPYLDITGRLTEQDKRAISAAQIDADATELACRYVDTLSGGEKQRVALGMILAQNTPIVLLDEPTAHLDQGYEASFLRTLARLKAQRKKTFLVVLHDLTAAVQYADDLLVLDGGELVFSGTKEECLERGILESVFSVQRFTFGEGEAQRIFFSPQ